ncbi:unnamed protein product, partial [Owenia fusiformis]
IPQISYASTSIELSDKTRFGYFSRVVPPDLYQVRAMVDIVRHFGWSYVSTVADEGNYGEKGISAFEDLALKSGICIAQSLKIPREFTSETYDGIMTSLFLTANAKVVVLFVNEDNARRLLSAYGRTNKTSPFYWLASDSWGAKIHPIKDQELAAEGALTILPKRKVLAGFDEYFLSRTRENNERNPWFDEYWQMNFNCTLDPTVEDKAICTGNEDTPEEVYHQEGVVPFVINAVKAIAYALNNLYHDKCDDIAVSACPELNPVDGVQLLSYIRNVSFIGSAGRVVRFNDQGDPTEGSYNIYQLQRSNTSEAWRYVSVGEWTDDLNMNESLIKWRDESLVRPHSVCSEECEQGYAKGNNQNEKKDHCCWICIKCGDYEYLKDEYTCASCPIGSIPNDTKNGCYELPVQSMEWNSVWAILPAAFSCLGIIATLFTFFVFWRFNRTPLIMAAGRELCYILMIGILMCYSLTFVLLSQPSTITCTIIRIGLGVSLSVCYAALFTKTNRISRIFNRGVKAAVKRPSYTSPRSQVVICMCLVAVQITAAVTWLGMELPGVRLVHPEREKVILKCRTSDIALVISLLYNIILIILCTLYAFRVRKIPENFNEAKYIAFTMYSTCIVWLAFIPIYFGTNNNFRIQITALCVCVSISATVTLGCLLLPKVYIVIFQPHKNVRQGGSSTIRSNASYQRQYFGNSKHKKGLAAQFNNGDITSPTGLAMLLAGGPVRRGVEEKDNSAVNRTRFTSIPDSSSGQDCDTEIDTTLLDDRMPHINEIDREIEREMDMIQRSDDETKL